MGGRWNLLGFQLRKGLFAVLLLHLLADECLSLNLEGLVLWEFRSRVEVDPYGAFENWDLRDTDPCNWSGVHCVDGNVEMLNLKELSLRGMLGPELGKLSHLRSLVLYKNNFSGIIPKEIGRLTMLELLDLRGNNFSGTIPKEIGEMLSLKRLLLRNNKFQGGTPSWIENTNMKCDLEYDRNFSCDQTAEVGCVNRKIRHCFWQTGLQQLKKANSLLIPLKVKVLHFLDAFSLFKFKGGVSHSHGGGHGGNLLAGFSEPYIMQNVHDVNTARRRLLLETSNLPAAPVSSASPREVVTSPSFGSGSFPAVPNSRSGRSPVSRLPPPQGSAVPRTNFSPPSRKPTNSADNEESSSTSSAKWIYIFVIPGAVLLVIAASILFMCRRHGGTTIGPWKSGISGQLQKVFVTGVPKLNRPELEAACEDFSNIISTSSDHTVFKGTLSSGVEIAVVSSAVSSTKDWSKRSEMCFRKKIDTISQVKHKNFVNLLGFCEEEEPFMRMMVFEYAPNGTLFEHLHIKEFEHLDWSARMRIIMGMAYCLQYMHHELNPPVAHPDLQSTSVFITDDYAAKIADMSIWQEVVANGKISGDDDMDLSQLSSAIPEGDVYNFGILLLETISGRIPFSKEHGSIVSWAAEYLNDRRRIISLTDPTMKSINDEELEVVCDVIQDCIHEDPKKRRTMREVTTKLKEVISISPEAATPRLSPLWWAELEILSVEAS